MLATKEEAAQIMTAYASWVGKELLLNKYSLMGIEETVDKVLKAGLAVNKLPLTTQEILQLAQHGKYPVLEEY